MNSETSIIYSIQTECPNLATPRVLLERSDHGLWEETHQGDPRKTLHKLARISGTHGLLWALEIDGCGTA